MCEIKLSFLFFFLYGMVWWWCSPSDGLLPSSQINLLRCIIVVEQSNSEVSNEVGDEESPVILRHGGRGEVQIVDDVDPHVARVVCQVLTEFLSWTGKQFRPVRRVQRRGHSNLAVNTDFVKVCTASPVSVSTLLPSLLFLVSASARAFKQEGAETGGITGAEGTVGFVRQRVQRSNNECKWRLSVVDSVPLVVLFE